MDVGIVEDEEGEGAEPDHNSPDLRRKDISIHRQMEKLGDGTYHICRLPRVNDTSPAEPHDEDQQAACKKNETHTILSLALLHFRPVHMEKVEVWRMIEEVEAHHSKARDNDIQVISPPPGSLRPLYQRWCYDWTETCKLEA